LPAAACAADANTNHIPKTANTRAMIILQSMAEA
jgi:hypothetical protein